MCSASSTPSPLESTTAALRRSWSRCRAGFTSGKSSGARPSQRESHRTRPENVSPPAAVSWGGMMPLETVAARDAVLRAGRCHLLRAGAFPQGKRQRSAGGISASGASDRGRRRGLYSTLDRWTCSSATQTPRARFGVLGDISFGQQEESNGNSRERPSAVRRELLASRISRRRPAPGLSDLIPSRPTGH